MKINSISRDFPFQSNFTNISPHKPKQEKLSVKMFPEIKNGYNNESPDFLLIDSMKENTSTYKNPHLGDVIKEDRNAFFKNINIVKDSIKIIDMLKTRKEYSQDLKYLKCIASSDDLNLMKQRQQINYRQTMSNSKDQKDFLKIDRELDKELFDKKIKQISYEYSPKHHYRFKNCLDLNSNENSLNELKLNIDPRKSSYFANFNDYDITENFAENKERFLNFKKKDFNSYNCITDEQKIRKSCDILTRKWDSFYEKYNFFIINYLFSFSFLLINESKRGFLKKGGLCTEFTDKNKWFIELNKKNEVMNNNAKITKLTDKKEIHIAQPNQIKKKTQNLEKIQGNSNNTKDHTENKGPYKLKSLVIQSNGINK